MTTYEPSLATPTLTEGVRRTVLANGLTVLTKEVHTHPIVASVLWYRVGARNESLGRTGTSHFLEHMLFKGTERYPKGSIDLVTLKHGGSNNAFTWLDYTAYYFTFASDRWEVALEIEADRMRGTLFEPDEFAAEKQVVLEELRIGLDGPWDELEYEVWATAYRQHPYHNPTVGWIQDLVDATADDMKAYYDAWYHPRNATLVLVGDFDTDRVLPRVEELFGSIPTGPESPLMRIVEPPQRGEKRTVVRKPTPVERLVMAYHVPEVGHPESYAVQVLEAALSLGKTSRLYRRLVETDRSVSIINAGYNDHVDPSLFVIRAEVKPGFTLAAVEGAIEDEIDKLARDGVSQAELSRVKRRIRADLVLSNEQVLNQAILLGEYETIAVSRHLGDDDRGYAYLNNYFERVDAVTSDDVRVAAATYLIRDNRTVGTLVSNGVAVADEAGGAAAAGEEAARRPVSYRRAPSREEGIDPSPLGSGGGAAPSGGKAPKLDVERFTLPNGLTVLLAPNSGVPAFCLSAVVGAGARYETDDVAGLASLAGSLLEEGTNRRTSEQIAEEIENVGGHLTTFGGYSHSGVRVVGLSEDLELGVDLAADCMRNPVFPEDRVGLYVDRRLALLKSRADQPRVKAAELFDEIVFAGHPSHRPTQGYEATVSGITRDRLVAFHHDFYSPDTTIIALAGRFDPAAAREAIERSFGDWNARRATPLVEPPEIARQTAPVERFVHADKSQVNLYLGHLGIRRNDPDYYTLLVLDTVLGSSPGFTSRIPRILRDEQGLAYSTFANVTGSAGLDPGRFVAYIGTAPTNLTKAIDGLRAEIERIVREPIEPDELETAKSYLTGSFVFKFQTNAQIAGYLVDAEIFGLGFDYLERYPRLVDAVTIDEVQRVARTHVDPSAMTLVVVGPTERG